MNLSRIFFLILMQCSLLISQSKQIQDVFSQSLLREDFNEISELFPTESKSNGKFAIVVDTLGEYFVGTDKEKYSVMLKWENDLKNFEIKSAITLSPEDRIDLFKKEAPQVIGIILKYNPNTQEGLIFQTNSFKKYRLLHLKQEGRSKRLTYSKDDGWVKSENLRRNQKNELLIKTQNNKFEFYINGVFEFKVDLNKKRIENLNNGRFGFYLGPQTKAKIDYLYISATKEYSGINKLLNLSEEDAKKIIAENEDLKEKIKIKETEKINELKNVLKIVENELQTVNKINDSLRKKNQEYEPFKDLLGENKDFMYTLTRDLTAQIEKNQILKMEKNKLLDSIETLIHNQEIFKLEYLKALDSVMGQEKKDTIE